MTGQARQIEPLITADQAAEILGMGVEWVRVEARARRLPAYKWGKYWKFSEAELRDWIRAHAEGPRIATVTKLDRRR